MCIKIAWESLGINIKTFGCWLEGIYVSSFSLLQELAFYFWW